MSDSAKAYERWKRLTPPLTPFPSRCGYCALHMFDDQQLTVFETASTWMGARVMHTTCYRKYRKEQES